MSHQHRIVFAGDSAVIVELDARIDPEVNARAIALAHAISHERHGGVHDVVPTYRSVAIAFDPLRTDLDRLLARIDALAAAVPARVEDRTQIDIPVCYGGELGPDLAEVAGFGGCSEDRVVELHSGEVYRVFMLGFVPGFAYMGTVAGQIASPRRLTPRLRVPAGSVGIAGPQTGIYPMETPAGWQIVGRTPLRPFDATRAEPFLFAAGDRVRFVPIDRATFERAVAIGEAGRGVPRPA